MSEMEYNEDLEVAKSNAVSVKPKSFILKIKETDE